MEESHSMQQIIPQVVIRPAAQTVRDSSKYTLLSMKALPREALKPQSKPQRLDAVKPYIYTPHNQYKVHMIHPKIL